MRRREKSDNRTVGLKNINGRGLSEKRLFQKPHLTASPVLLPDAASAHADATAPASRRLARHLQPLSRPPPSHSLPNPRPLASCPSRRARCRRRRRLSPKPPDPASKSSTRRILPPAAPSSLCEPPRRWQRKPPYAATLLKPSKVFAASSLYSCGSYALSLSVYGG
uniref:Uncharacterized protein n=1 Tax=Oryza brachyantha TaxID=4533 RepID=J3MVC9_ORYBR